MKTSLSDGPMVAFYDWTMIVPIIAIAAPILFLLFYFFVKTIDRAAAKRVQESPPPPNPALFEEDVTEEAENQ